MAPPPVAAVAASMSSAVGYSQSSARRQRGRPASDCAARYEAVQRAFRPAFRGGGGGMGWETPVFCGREGGPENSNKRIVGRARWGVAQAWLRSLARWRARTMPQLGTIRWRSTARAAERRFGPLGPARKYKSAIQNRSTVGNAKGA